MGKNNTVLIRVRSILVTSNPFLLLQRTVAVVFMWRRRPGLTIAMSVLRGRGAEPPVREGGEHTRRHTLDQQIPVVEDRLTATLGRRRMSVQA